MRPVIADLAAVLGWSLVGLKGMLLGELLAYHELAAERVGARML